jgi:uncharacterized membrane protein/mono/diheme cytochrome c family protein
MFAQEEPAVIPSTGPTSQKKDPSESWPLADAAGDFGWVNINRAGARQLDRRQARTIEPTGPPRLPTRILETSFGGTLLMSVQIRRMREALFVLGLSIAATGYGQEPPATPAPNGTETPPASITTAEPSAEPSGQGPANAIDGEAAVRENCMQCHRSDNPKYPDHNVGWVYGKRYELAGWKDNIQRMEKIALRDEFISEAWPEDVKQAMAQHLYQETKAAWTDTERVGMFHYSVVHFPIALLFIVLLFDGLGLVLGWPLKHDWVHLLLLLAVISAAAASGFGLLLAKDMTTMSEDLADHRIAGLATLGLAAGAFLLREISLWTRATWSKWGYRLLLLLAAASVGAAGHLGGMLVHGEFIPFLVSG